MSLSDFFFSFRFSFRRIAAFITLLALTSVVFSGCFKKEASVQDDTPESVELVYYKLFDNEDVIRPMVEKYRAQHPNVNIVYRKFDDPEEYLNLLVNELAEGEGPDIFSVPNSWILRNIKKITPMPSDMMTPVQFGETFVSVAMKDMVFPDPVSGRTSIFGIPLQVDTLALYYNKSQYDDKIPSRGRPPQTWEELKEDVFQLTKKDNSFERFELSGIAMGRADNIARATDILYLLMLQHGIDFYNDNISRAEFARQRSSTATGLSVNPASQALDLYTSFALPASKNYSWNAYLSSSTSAEKELETFARGKVAMVFGYSYLYEQILAKIQDLKSRGVTTIDPDDVGISLVPQVNDPDVSTEKRDAYANYFVETVGRNTVHAREAWDFLLFMSSKENLEYYNEKTHRPTSRRDMIEDQKQDPVYGVYAEQIGYAESFPMYDTSRYDAIFRAAIEAVLATVSPTDAVRLAEEQINLLLPQAGLLPRAAEGASGSNAGESDETQETSGS